MRLGRIVQIVWITGFVIGTSTHVLELLGGGLETYGSFPTPLRLFWVSLTVIDPLVVLFLALRRRTGVALGLAVIIVDIAVNWTVFATIGGHPLFGVVSQSVFAAILITTALPLWRWMPVDRA